MATFITGTLAPRGHGCIFPSGQKLGRYRIEEEIGAGGMGVVYCAYDEKLERDLALKVLSPGTLDDEVARKRFRNEARMLSRLNHPAIQTIHDFDTIEGTDILVSELVRGQSLDARVACEPCSWPCDISASVRRKLW